jgi:stress response protein YsnF
MAYETIVAAFDTPEHARAAVKALKAGGFHGDDISIFDRDRVVSMGNGLKQGLKEPGLWRRMFGEGIREHEATVFGQTVQQGGAVISVRVLDSEVAHATGILDVHKPMSVADRAITTGVAPAPKVEALQREAAATPLAANQRVATSPKVAELNSEVLRLAEEQLEVGKEMVVTGRTRVRRFTTEREVSSDVSLHEEHAEVLRRAITEPTSFKNIDWSDGEIEMVETAEHALANKTARIVEEISLKKVGSDHVETIRERLRRQQAEIVKVDASGNRIGPQA